MCSKTAALIRSFVNTRIKPEVVKDILIKGHLDVGEIISIIFLMVDKNTDFSKVIKEIKEDALSALIRLTSKNDWAGKLLESLILIRNREVIGLMRFSKEEIQIIENAFLTEQHTIICYLNKAIISLYCLCENLIDDEVKELVTYVNNKLHKPVKINDKKLYLELYILEWLNQGFISIDPDNLNLSHLMNLTSNNYKLDLPFLHNDWEEHKPFVNENEPDSSKYPFIPTNQCDSQYTSWESEYISIVNNKDIMWSTPEHKRLCIIVNQINFIDTETYEMRKGSEIDEKSLEETFKGCGFEIQKHRDLKKYEMMNLLEFLNSKDNTYATYGAIFMCILSHGLADKVIFSDDKHLPIITIRDKFCCRKLRNVFKFVIVQSCQGNQIGSIQTVEKHSFSNNSALRSDGPSDCNSLHRAHFGLFHATTRDFAAMRDENKGSLFIQNLCRVIQNSNNIIKVSEMIEKVMYKVSNIRSASAGNKFQKIVQQPELWFNTMFVPYLLIPKFTKLIKNKN